MDPVFQRTELRAICLLIIALLVMPVSNAANSESSSLGRVVIPDPITPANRRECVEPADVMRRDHMQFLIHQRDQTVFKGIRTQKYSLTGCVNCHAQADKNGEIVRADDPDYFCTGCHNYTAVKIDCFECHSDRAAKITSALEPGNLNLNSSYSDLPARDLRYNRLHRSLLLQVEIRDQQ